jgi:hypothetical protein
MNIGLKASETAKAYLAGLDLETVENFYAEVEDPSNADDTQANQREYPCVVCYCSAGEEYPQFTGNYNCDLFFRIEASADDHTSAQLDAIFEEIWAQISTDTILSDLTAAGEDFTAIGMTGGVSQTAQSREGRTLVKSIVLPINCCAFDLS